MADLYAGSNDDTVWTKNIWPENVLGVMFSRDRTTPGDSKIFVSTNALVRIYDTQTGDSIGIVKGVGDFKVYSPDGKFIYTNGLRKLDAKTLNVVALFDSVPYKNETVCDVSLTGDGQFLIATFTPSGTDGLPINNIGIYSSIDMKLFKAIKFSELPCGITTSPDGKYFVTNSWAYTDWQNKTQPYYRLILWDAHTFQQIKTIYKDTTNNDIPVIKFTPDSKYLAAAIGGQDWLYTTNNFSIYKKFGDFTTAIVFSNDVKFMITGGSATQIWNLNNFNRNYEYNRELSWGRDGVDVTKDSKYIISASGSILSLFNGRLNNDGIIEKLKEKDSFVIYPNPINGIANISFNNSLMGNYDIKILNNVGNEISKLFGGFLDIGNMNFQWNTENQPSGIYFCRIIGTKTNLIYKIIVNK